MIAAVMAFVPLLVLRIIATSVSVVLLIRPAMLSVNARPASLQARAR